MSTLSTTISIVSRFVLNGFDLGSYGIDGDQC